MLHYIAMLMLLLAPATQPSSVVPLGAEDPQYTQAIEKRANDIIALLKITDDGKTQRVREILMNQYRALRDWEAEHIAKLKDKTTTAEEKTAIIATRKPLHDSFLAKLGEELSPEQIETVKDKMTYNKVKVTYDGYLAMLPQLTDEQKGKILAWLKDAREEAIDGGSSEEKSKIFDKYKGRINNYLSKEGYDLKQASKDWAERRKAQQEK
jgi:hypothetical protein